MSNKTEWYLNTPQDIEMQRRTNKAGIVNQIQGGRVLTPGGSGKGYVTVSPQTFASSSAGNGFINGFDTMSPSSNKPDYSRFTLTDCKPNDIVYDEIWDKETRVLVFRGLDCFQVFVGFHKSHPLAVANVRHEEIQSLITAHGGLNTSGIMSFGPSNDDHFWYGWKYNQPGDKMVKGAAIRTFNQSQVEEIDWTVGAIVDDSRKTIKQFIDISRIARILTETDVK